MGINLRSVYWHGALKQHDLKTGGLKQGLSVVGKKE
jgi:hypothetical protein